MSRNSGSNGAGGVPSSELFPDLHHKMSKKIAQLTKVIYHLNTRNEDHQSEIDILTNNHRYELQQMLNDAASRMAKFKELIDAKQAAVNTEALLDKMQKKHEEEKTKSTQELQTLKTKFSEREMKLTNDFKAKTDSLKEEVVKMNAEFQKKINAFETKTQELKKALEDSKLSSSAGAEELRMKYDKEIAEVVRIHNDKYQAMLVEQLQLQEQIRKDAAADAAKACKDLESRLLAEHEKLIGQIRAQMSAEKQEALMALRRENEEKLQQQRDELTGKLEKCLAELKLKMEECERLRREKDDLAAELSRQIQDMQKSLGDQLGGSEQKAAALAMELSDLKEKARQLSAQVKERDEEIARLQQLLSDKNMQLSKLESKVESVEKEVSRLTAELQKAQQSGSALENSLRAQLQTTEKERDSLRNEMNQMGTTVASLREDIKKAEKNAAKASADYEKQIAALNAEKERLTKLMAESANSSAAANDKAAAELANLRKRLADREEEIKRQVAEMEENSRKATESLKSQHKAEIDALNQARQALLESSTSKQAQLMADMEAMQEANTARIAKLVAEHGNALDQARTNHKADVDSLQEKISSLEAQLQAISDAADGAQGALKAEVSKLESKAKALQKELDAKKKEGERAEGVCQSLKNQVESLREELKATQKAYRDKMDQGLAQLEADWQAKLDAQIAKHETDLAAALADLGVTHKGVMDELIKSHEEEILNLKNLLSKESSAASDQITKLENEKIRLEGELRTEKQERSAQVAELTDAHSKEKLALDAARLKELEALKKELNAGAHSREQALIAASNAEIAALREASEKAQADLEARNAESLARNIKSSEEALRAALFEQETRLNAVKKEELSIQAKELGLAHEATKAQLEKAISALQQELESVKGSRDLANNEVAQLSKQITSERAARQKREEEFVLERDQHLRDHEIALRREKESSERKIIEVTDRHTADMKLLKEEFNDDRLRFDERLRDAQKEYADLLAKYRNRESRQEDVARIQQLEQELVAKEELVQKTREEMMYFKREMLNREESYNQKFNRQPNVGVMNPIKVKDSDSMKVPGKSSNKPTYAVAPGGQGGAMGMPGMGAGRNQLIQIGRGGWSFVCDEWQYERNPSYTGGKKIR